MNTQSEIDAPDGPLSDALKKASANDNSGDTTSIDAKAVSVDPLTNTNKHSDEVSPEKPVTADDPLMDSFYESVKSNMEAVNINATDATVTEDGDEKAPNDEAMAAAIRGQASEAFSGRTPSQRVSS